MCIVCSVASLLLYLVIEIERLVGFWLLAASTFSADLTGSRLFDHLTWRAALLSFRFFFNTLLVRLVTFYGVYYELPIYGYYIRARFCIYF